MRFHSADVCPGVRHSFFPNTLEQEKILTMLTEQEHQHEQLFRQYHDKASEEYSVMPLSY
jgi:hypothetical protein